MDRDEMSDYNRGWHDGFDDGFASADDWYVEHEAELEKHGFIKLPRDADDVPIRVGDVMECGEDIVFTVESIDLHTFGWRCGGDGIDGNGYKCTAHPLPNSCRHHHAPTVEDVLREFAERYLDYEGMPSAGRRGIGEALMDEYAAKLRLAGDAE